MTLCGDVCVDLGNAKSNCGACGHACAASEICVGGVCQTPTPCAEQGQSCATANCCVGYCGQDETCECVSDGLECAHINTGGCCTGQPCNPDGYCGVCGTPGATCASDAECCQGNYAALCCAGVCTDVTNIGFVCPCAQTGESCTSLTCCVGFCGQDETCECVADGSECAQTGTGGCCTGQPCNADGFCGTCRLFGVQCNSDAECCSGGQYGAALCCFDGVSLTTRCTDVTNIGFVCPGSPPDQ